MIWGILLCCLAPPASGSLPQGKLPFFHGHVFENSPAASKVNGLSIPVTRVNAQKWCPAASGMRFKLYGNGSDDFRAFAHHKRGNVLLKTSRVLDRELRSEYRLSLARCCRTCASVASVKVDVLDTNDHQPTFLSASSIHISLDDTAALRSVIYRLEAADEDGGKNAELAFVSVPANGSLYVVPKTGEVLLVDSILGRNSTIKVYVYARDHGWPPLTSRAVLMSVTPRRWGGGRSAARAGRAPRALLDPGTVMTLNVSEDVGVGSVVVSLNPARFQSAAYELIFPEAESAAVSVGRDSGDLTVTRRLDREAEPVLELTVKVQDKQGVLSDTPPPPHPSLNDT
ncbi:hypothetical protein OJAV_G00059930 [Oryzias javanicus]|uniref:Cadherin domain-containing protein n=1 Tax=Oryzias javanicus TaxID=123683 RepID=A0A437DBE4_ORYJA|nr:hypothetical protein OJAV_G00059930 [Oryzias javanicus]